MRHAIGDAHFKRRTCLVVVAFLASGCLTNHIAPVVAQSTPDIATIKAERDALTRAYVHAWPRVQSAWMIKNLTLAR